MNRIAMLAAALRQVFADRAVEVAERQATDSFDSANQATWNAIVAALRSSAVRDETR